VEILKENQFYSYMEVQEGDYHQYTGDFIIQTNIELFFSTKEGVEKVPLLLALKKTQLGI